VAHPRDKPRVERGVSYARESFFGGRTFASLVEMRAAAVVWCREVAGQRVHGTPRERPGEAFLAREQAALQPLPPHPWEIVRWTSALVQADCHLAAGGARYSVPYPYVGQRLEVRLGQRVVEIYAGSTLVTTHTRLEHGRATRTEHYPEAGQAFLRATPHACLRQAELLGVATGRLVEALLETPTLTHLREVQALLRLTERYEAARLERACARALAAGDGRYRTVRGILDRGFDQLDPEETPPPRETAAFLRGAAAFAEVGR
jgi:hypothetical protein